MTDLTEAFGCEDLRTQSVRARALARALVADAHLADDLAQQLLLGHITAAADHNRAGQPKWVAGALRNLARKAWRTDERRRRREREAARPEQVACTAEVVQKAETLQHVVEAALALDEPYRTTILLRYLEDRPVDEVACAMGVPASTVRVRSKRALERLRTSLRSKLGAGYLVFLHEFAENVPPAAVVPAGPSAAPSTPTIQGTSTMKTITLLGATAGTATLAAVAFLWSRTDAPDPTQSTTRGDASASWTMGGVDVPAGARQPVPAATSEADSTVATAVPLRGRVVDHRGRPVIDADVRVYPHLTAGSRGQIAGHAPDAVGFASTDASGVFTVPDLHAFVGWDVVVRAPDRATALHYLAPQRPGPVTLYPAATVTGIVRDAKTGLALKGVTVRATGCSLSGDGPSRCLQAVTDEQGAYRLEGLAAEQNLVLELSRSGSVPQALSVNLQARIENRRDVEWMAGSAVKILVREQETSYAVPSAAVYFRGLGDPRLLGHTDGTGVLSVEMARPRSVNDTVEYRAGLSAWADGFTTTSRSLRGPAAKVVMPLVRSGRVEGIVRGGNGQPVGGARVFWTEQPVRVLQISETERASYQTSPGLDSHYATTDSSGRFVLPHTIVNVEGAWVIAGVLAVQTEKRVVEARDVLPSSPGEVRSLTIEVEAGLTLAGRATVNGKGAAAWVSLVGERIRHTVRATDDGRYAFQDLPPGEYKIEAIADGAPLRSEARTVDLEDNTNGIDVAMQGELRYIRGSVLRDDGTPAVGLNVMALVASGAAAAPGLAVAAEFEDVTEEVTEEVSEEGVAVAMEAGTGGVAGFTSSHGSAVVGEDGTFALAIEGEGERFDLMLYDGVYSMRKRSVEISGDVEWRLPVLVPVRFELAEARAGLIATWKQPATGREQRLEPYQVAVTSDGIAMFRLPAGDVQVSFRHLRTKTDKTVELQVPARGFDRAIRVDL